MSEESEAFSEVAGNQLPSCLMKPHIKMRPHFMILLCSLSLRGDCSYAVFHMVCLVNLLFNPLLLHQEIIFYFACVTEMLC